MQCRNLVVVSDLHCGCRLGLVPPGVKRIRLDDGGWYVPSPLQRKIAEYWREFWEEFVPSVVEGEPYAVCVNGDAMDGTHHDSVHQVSHNLVDQAHIARMCLEPVVERAERYYHIRGTEAHSGKSGQNEEALAESLGAKPNEDGQRARYELWIRIGGKFLAHILHHIGVTGSQAYETTAVHKELVEAFVEAGRWDDEAPDIIVRSHRHRAAGTSIPTDDNLAYGIVTPGWQGKTPWTYKIPGARQSQPQFGGLILRQGDNVGYFRQYTKTLRRPKPE